MFESIVSKCNPFSKAPVIVTVCVVTLLILNIFRPNPANPVTLVLNLPESKNGPVKELQPKETKIIEERKSKMVLISECNCTKRMFDYNEFPSDWNHTELDSTCSSFSYARGPGQKVVSYSYFHPSTVTGMHHYDQFKRKYFQGIKSNVERIMEVYPGWIMRLYFNIEDKQLEAKDKLCRLACDENNNIDLCRVEMGNKDTFLTKAATKMGIEKGRIQERPLVWRYWGVLDVTVDLFLSRDLDSLPTKPRETAAVAEFLSSPTALFHIMRDHPDHGATILAGTWGAKVNKARNEFETRMKRVFNGLSSSGDTNAYDQSVLSREFWSWVKGVSMAHDSFLCTRYGGVNRPFPTQRPNELNNFVGGGPSGQMPEVPKTICPPACRPKEHQDWIRC